MNSYSFHTIKDYNFSLRPSARELTEIDILCFISSWTEQDYNEMQKVPFFNSWLLETSESFSIGMLSFNNIFQELEIRTKALAKRTTAT